MGAIWWRSRSVWLGAASLVALAVTGGGCATSDGEGLDDPAKPHGVDPQDPATDDRLRERPWEVVSNKGETYLADVFYADASQNEQIIPWSLDKPAIDRLVYPTLGNPNLYVKSDDSDELVVVLRIEPDAFDFLQPKLGAADGDAPREVTLKSDDRDGFAFYLVGRSARERATESTASPSEGSDVFRIAPKKVLENAEPKDMPESLKTRKTLRFVFDKQAMAKVPAGLYDARFEVKKGGQVYANVFEYQYNAVRVFDREPDEYKALNVTDTQVSVGARYQVITADMLDDFVDAVNATTDPEVTSAAFITFNGDLHNGGAPESIFSGSVALTYQKESARVIGALKRLDYPIFLTMGNHDGYVGLGHVPSAVAAVDGSVGETMEEIVKEQNNIAWPDFSWDAYAAFLKKTDAHREGVHLDLFRGRFARKPGMTFSEAWKEIPQAERNYILYDGVYQWQKSYGPVYTSWKFGKNRYVSVDSYELRQHRRTGWGMYTVNYGGGIGVEQMDWIDRELARSRVAGEDVVMLMHHDPRGGHKGKDFGYYFPQLEYQSVQQSVVNYILQDKLTPIICGKDDVELTHDERDACLHDGLQEWHAPDAELDRDGAGVYFSATEVLTKIAQNPQVRTLVLGHTHFNSLEVIQKGEELVPGKVNLDDAASPKRLSSSEAANPVRRFAWEARFAPGQSFEQDVGHPSLWGKGKLDLSSFDSWRGDLDAMLARASTPAMRVLSNGSSDGPRELAILRLTSAAELTHQTYGGKSMFGWSVLHVTKQGDLPRVNRVTFYIHQDDGTFAKIKTIDVDRTKSVRSRGPDNPVDQLFDW